MIKNKWIFSNYVLNKKDFNIKSIMLIFGYFHKSRLLYGLPTFIEQKSWIDRIDKNIKKLLKLLIRTNNNRLKIALWLPNLNTYLICRLLKLKQKYEYIFNEKSTMYNKIIKEIVYINDIPSNVYYNSFITQKLKYLGEKERCIINEQFNNRLKNRIYSCW